MHRIVDASAPTPLPSGWVSQRKADQGCVTSNSRLTGDGPNDSQVPFNGCCSTPGRYQSQTPVVKIDCSRASCVGVIITL